MTLHIYSYIRDALHCATQKAFPDIMIKPESIPLFFKSPLSEIDLSSPLALKIASQKKLPSDRIASCIMSFFNWDEWFVIPDPLLNKTIFSGFITFRLSSLFLVNNLNKTAEHNASYYGELPCGTDKEFEPAKDILKRIDPLLRHAEKSIPANSIIEIEQANLLCSSEENRLMRLLSVSHEEQIYSSDAAMYFLQHLIYVLDRYINTSPVFTLNNDLTLARVILIRASYNRLVGLIKKTGYQLR